MKRLLIILIKHLPNFPINPIIFSYFYYKEPRRPDQPRKMLIRTDGGFLCYSWARMYSFTFSSLLCFQRPSSHFREKGRTILKSMWAPAKKPSVFSLKK